MNIALFHFIRPYWLLAFIPLIIITRMILKRKLQGGVWLNVCDEALLPYILQQKPIKKTGFSMVGINVIASALIILALASPTWERVPSPAFRNDSGLVIALSLSQSMEAGDIKPSRLIRARYKIEDILKQRKDGQTALLVYAGDAFTVTPLTNDNATIASQLEALTPEIMPSEGNNTVLAVEKAVELFKQAGLQNGQVLLITDNLNTNEIAAAVQKLENYQLSVLAVGTEEGAPISEADGGFLKDESGKIVIPKLPVAALQKLAQDGQGIYQTLSDNDSDIKNLLAVVDKTVQKSVDKNNQNNLLLEKWDEKGVWLLLLVLPLAALNFRRGLLALTFLFLLPLPKNSYAYEWRDLWQTKNQQAQQAFNNKEYDKAAKLFEDPAWQAAALYKANHAEVKELKTPTTATGFYNQGNVFAKAGEKKSSIEAKIEKFQQAIKAYDEALKREPNNADAKDNKEIVEKELKKLKQQQEQQKQADKNQQKSDNKDQKDSKDKQDKQDKQDKKDKQDNKDNKDSKENQSDKSEQNQPKPEQSDTKKDSQSPQQKQQQDKQQQQQAAQAKKQPPEKSPQKSQMQQAQVQEDEKKQADEQWLNRIPDDPAGLLRRKFKYQYGQRQQREPAAQSW